MTEEQLHRQHRDKVLYVSQLESEIVTAKQTIVACEESIRQLERDITQIEMNIMKQFPKPEPCRCCCCCKCGQS